MSNQRVTLSADQIRAALEAMPSRPLTGGAPRLLFTKEQDKMLVEWKKRRTWGQLVKAFGYSEGTLRRRWRELTEEE